MPEKQSKYAIFMVDLATENTDSGTDEHRDFLGVSPDDLCISASDLRIPLSDLCIFLAEIHESGRKICISPEEIRISLANLWIFQCPSVKSSVFSVAMELRKTEAAKAAAPKPLSILTTATPLAQELSIPSSAAKPPKAAP